MCVCLFKQKTAYEMRISDWSSDVCSSDLAGDVHPEVVGRGRPRVDRVPRAQGAAMAIAGGVELVARVGCVAGDRDPIARAAPQLALRARSPTPPGVEDDRLLGQGRRRS